MLERLRFFWNRLRERLWVRPLAMCLVSIAALVLAKWVDRVELGWLPEVNRESIETLLSIMAASMLVIATFAVSSMVSAYASASSAATPRSFALVIADDSSQNALSTFVGAFIFSITALVASKNGHYEETGRFMLFALSILMFAVVILMFVRWVDSIARLGRMGSTIAKVEKATAVAMRRRRRAPHLNALAPAADGTSEPGEPICGAIGYVQRVDLGKLQACAEKAGLQITVEALPGAFSAPGRPLAFVTSEGEAPTEEVLANLVEAFVIGADRTFDDDPRFGLVVLSQIASRALSPAVNDAGTAIDVVGSVVRLFAIWGEPEEQDAATEPKFDRVAVPALDLEEMFDDAFTAIARDGAGIVEVGVWLQNAFAALAATEHAGLRAAAEKSSEAALARAEQALTLPADVAVLQRVAARLRAKK